MRDEISVKTLGTSTELLVISDLKQDFIKARDSITYATRLRILLRTLNSIRKIGLEEKGNTVYIGPIDRLQTIHQVRWTVIDENRRMLLAVTFDRPLETYVRRIVNIAGPVLDAILCHCEDYENKACWQGHDGFAQYVAENQVDVDLYGTSAPNLTVDDITYLKDLETKQQSMSDIGDFDRKAATLNVKTQSDKVRQALKNNPEEAKDQALDLIRAMYRLKTYFPGPEEGESHIGSDLFYLERLTAALVFGFKPSTLTDADKRKFKREIKWFNSFKSIPTQEISEELDKDDIQSGIVDAHKKANQGHLMLLRFNDPTDARNFLSAQMGELSTASSSTKSDVYCNFALTFNGLKSLGLSESLLRKFPKEFRDGMESRAGTLGDIGDNHPDNWSLPKHAATGRDILMSSVDMVVQLQANANDPAEDHGPLVDKMNAWKQSAAQHNVDVLATEPLHRFGPPQKDGRVIEHFGFLDGVSQPHAKESDAKKSYTKHKRDEISLGELFLGYNIDREDAVAAEFQPPISDEEAELDEFLKNSTFMVIRKLYQDVGALNKFVNGASSQIDRASLEAKMMGRYKDGTPLLPPGVDAGETLNDFDYAIDPDGVDCPLHSHTRRTNPRIPTPPKAEGSPTPRILRRGFSYGTRYSHETADEERGLFFMAYNASIAEQFEVVQRWINGGNSTGTFSKQNDAVVGSRPLDEKRSLRFIEDTCVHRFELPEKPFVKLQWGLYLFVPSMSALDKLSRKTNELPKIADQRELRGTRSLVALELHQKKLETELALKIAALPSPNPDLIRKWTIETRRKVAGAWKALLEDPSGEDLADEVWAKIRSIGGVFRSPYGVLIGDMEKVKAVFQDKGETYSTREYWHRMKQSIGDLYLGMDPCPAKMPPDAHSENPARDSAFEDAFKKGDYEEIADPTNKWIGDISEDKAFDDAVKVSRDWFANKLLLKQDPDLLELKEYVADVVGQLSVDWFGLPTNGSIDIGGEPGDKPNTPDDLVSASYYFFGPRPTESVIDVGKQRGTKLKDVIRSYVDESRSAPDGTLFSYLLGEPVFKGKAELITKTLVGCTNGFVAATRGSFLAVMRQWIENEDLWRHRLALLTATATNASHLTHEIAQAALKKELVIGMQKRARPNLLHRVATKDTTLGGVDIKAGEVVVLSLQSAAENYPGDPEILFGGNYCPAGHGTSTTVHACSGQAMALGVLLGIISVMMEQNTLDADTTFTLSLSKS